jgi:hypothetical protein
LTPQHVWWVSWDGLFALDTTVPNATPTTVVAGSLYATIQADPTSERVLLIHMDNSPPLAPELVTIDGTRTPVVGASEDLTYGYRDVWFAGGHAASQGAAAAHDVVGGELRALDVFYGCGCEDGLVDAAWTQLVVYALDSNAPPRELGHATYAGFAPFNLGVERSRGTYVTGDAWYRVP